MGYIILYQLRASVDDFVGRQEEINELIKTLRNGGHASVICISGMGGIGKTELALLVANQLRSDYLDAQLFIEMRGTDEQPLTSADALAACIRPFVRLEAKLPADINELTRLYRSSLSNKRVLVVLDNAANQAQISQLLPPTGCALLVTSRNAIALQGLKRIALDQLKPNEARHLLLSTAPRVTSEMADQICELCGYLPLAIRATGSLLAVMVDLEPTDYKEQLRNERKRLERIGTEGVEIGVEASFNLSYARLKSEPARVFRQLAVFPSSFDAAAEEMVCEDAGHIHLSNLVRRSLVLYDGETKRYRLHDLMSLFASARLNGSERAELQRRHAVHYETVLRAANALYLKGGEGVQQGLRLFDLEWRNIQTGQGWAKAAASEATSRARSADRACSHVKTLLTRTWELPTALLRRVVRHRRIMSVEALCSDYPDAGFFLLFLRQHPRERIEWLEAGLEAARRLKRRDAEGRRLGNLGVAYWALGEVPKAIKYYRQARTIAQEIGDLQGEGRTTGNLGIVYYTLGEVPKAIKYNEQARAIAQEIGDLQGEGEALGNLGNAYAALGELDKAISYHERHRAIAQEIGDRRGEGRALGNLGSAYATLGEVPKAIKYNKQARAIAQEIGDRRGEGYALGNLGNAYAALGELDKAISYHERHRAIAQEIGDRRREGVALWSKSLALDRLGYRSQAIACAEAALVLFEQTEDPKATGVREQLAQWQNVKRSS